MNTKNVFVLAIDDFNRSMLERLRGREHLAVHELLDMASAVDSREYDIPALLDRARSTLHAFPGSIDAIVGYWDFPSTVILPVLRREMNLPGPSLESVLRCDHKYWARLEEKKVAPRETPQFAAFDPFAENAIDNPPLPYPFWMKPVCTHSSQLGFRIDSHQDFEHAVNETRARIDTLGQPLNELMKLANVPASIARIDGKHCIAEEIICSDHQCTLEGYVLNGEVYIYGVIDSLREGQSSSSFTRYEYPSCLPVDITAIMKQDTEILMKQIEYDDAPFNIEFFYNEKNGDIFMLEVNSRISQSHSYLFEMVDGVSNMQVMVDVALQRKPDFPPEGGEYRRATKFMLREYGDARVERAPTADEVRAIEQDIPGCHIDIKAQQSTRLSDMLHQDSYTFEIATLFVGGQSRQDIEDKADRIRERLQFRFNHQRGDRHGET